MAGLPYTSLADTLNETFPDAPRAVMAETQALTAYPGVANFFGGSGKETRQGGTTHRTLIRWAGPACGVLRGHG